MFPTHHFWKQPRRLRFYRMVLLGLWMLAGLAAAAPVQAMIPYDTEYYEHNLELWVDVQPIYIPHRYITGESELGPGFAKPNDLHIAGDGRAFVADTGNNRIVVLNRLGEVVAVVGIGEGEGKLSAPEGVFVDEAGTIYVADTGNKRIAVFDAQGQYIREYARPQSSLLPAADQYFFVPSKLVVDARGVMYIVVKGSYQGILRMDGNGEFTGFFGANKTPVTFLDRLKATWMTKEQQAKEIAKRPLEVRNLALDGEGFIYTVTPTYSGQVKRLNASGTDTLKGKTFSNADTITDVAIDEDGMMYVLDAEKGKTTIYTAAGQPLFTFGDRQMTALQFGVLSQPSAIAVGGDDELWIVDSHLSVVEIFKKTEFGEDVMQAVKYDFMGDYKQSKPYWQAAIEQNDYLTIGYRGLGHSYSREDNHEQAMEYYRISFDATGYSEAFWNIRLQWLQSNFVYLLGMIVVGLWGSLRGLRWLKGWMKGRQWSPRLARYGSELKAAWVLLFHPYNGFYYMKDRKISFTVLALLALLAIGTRLLHVYGVGFVFNPTDRSWISLPWTLIGFIVPWFTWVIANYLVSTVKDGEGRFREVLQTSIYAMIPYVIWVPLLTLLSHFIVLEERILYDAGIQIVTIWVIVMFFVMTQVIHNFEFMETAKNTMISVITIVLIWIFAVIMGGLGYNLFDFFGQVIREVKLYG